MEDEISVLPDRLEVISCTASPGDIWAYRTPIVHASAEQRRPGRRRVLQIDYSASDLPCELEWLPLI